MPTRFILVLTIFLLPALALAADPALLTDAEQAYAQDRKSEALTLINQYLAADTQNPKAYLLRALIRSADNQWADTLPDFDKAIALDPNRPAAYQRRAIARFMLGHVKDACEDFDAFNAKAPDAAPQNWQRGIALYYAGRYDDGVKQFELHRTVNPDDVENAAWHFACLARANSPAAARAALIPIEGDPRVPMAQIHQMFAGKATPADVLTAATANNPTPNELKRHLFYAHLYIALYCESIGKDEEAKKHLTESLKHEVPDYMYGVAKVHAQLRKWPPAKM